MTETTKPNVPAWQPTASLDFLKRRAAILSKIRQFFAVRGVIEVETPALCQAGVSDPHLASIACQLVLSGSNESQSLYLQTSPEYAMKRLLAAGSGPIYQIAKAFRADEAGRWHNPEFTMLEWYRPAFTHRDLMIEVDALLRHILNCEVSYCVSYGDLFAQHFSIDPYQPDIKQLRAVANQHDIFVQNSETLDETTWLQLLMANIIEPTLGFGNQATMVIDFPPEQAALAKIHPGPPAVAERFEVYWQGMELANGFHELLDAHEQRSRFEANNAWREKNNLPVMALDEKFLAALDYGLPSCAGVALGVDRLIMAALNADNLEEVIAFPIERA